MGKGIDDDAQRQRDAERAKATAQGNAKASELIRTHPEVTHIVITTKGNNLAVSKELAEVYRSKMEKGKMEEKSGRPNRSVIAKVEPITGARK